MDLSTLYAAIAALHSSGGGGDNSHTTDDKGTLEQQSLETITAALKGKGKGKGKSQKETRE